MDSIFNLEEFHKSITGELVSARNRVRNLIGNKNWGEEGRYKEAILRNLIKRFISPRYIVGTGFIVKNVNGKIRCTAQIDILIFDSNYPILFSEGDFYIVTPNSVKAVIEVKTRLRSGDLTEVVEKINEIGSFLEETCMLGKYDPFIGIFSYEGHHSIPSLESNIKDRIINGIKNQCYIDCITLNKDIFIKYPSLEDKFQVYHAKDFSFSFFISNLIKKVMDEPMGDESPTWFPKDKGNTKLFDIDVDI